MVVTPIRTQVVRAGSISLHGLIDSVIAQIDEGSVLVITSKVVSLCEGRVVPITQVNREDLIRQESHLYLPPAASKYGHHFSIVDGTIVGSAGIDESNGDGNYVLWPTDSQRTANTVRAYLREKYGLQRLGVMITDSISTPLRLGALSSSLAHSGFKALKNYIGEPDLFNHPYAVSRSNVAGGLAAAAGVAMGEGSESTPLCLLSDLPFVEFQADDPSDAELDELKLSIDTDLFGPFLSKAPWQQGERS